MTLQNLFEKFELIASAPNAVARIRELVVNLAVRGKLIGQNDDDALASELLAQAAKERAALIKERRIRKRDTSPVSEEEKLFEVPKTWAWARLYEVGHELGQKNPDTSFTYIDIASIDAAKGRISDRVQILAPSVAPSRARKRVEVGSVIYSTVRPYLRNVAIVDHRYVPPPIASTAFSILHPYYGFDSRYIYLWLRSDVFNGYVQECMKGMAYPSITDQKFYDGMIAVPPPAEQKRIVEKVEELLGLCDRLDLHQQEQERQEKTLASAALARFSNSPSATSLEHLFHSGFSIVPADLRECILTLAVEGRLLPREADDESAEHCFSRLGLVNTLPQDQRKDSIPANWCRARFNDVAEIAGGVTLGRHLGNRETVTLPYLRVANVKRGHLDLEVVKDVSIGKDEVQRYAVQENDLLVTEGGDSDKVGRAAVWRGEIPLCLHQNHVFRCRMRASEMKPDWFECYFNSPPGRRYFESAAKQTTNLASINMRQVRDCPVPFPSIAEQERIVAKVNELMWFVDKLEAEIEAAKSTSSELLAAIVAHLTGITHPLRIRPDMKSNTIQRERRNCVAPLKLTTKRFVLRRFAMASNYRSLRKFDCLFHSNVETKNEATPICLVGLNGSGKSNLIEAIAEIFCYLELLSLPWEELESKSSRYKQNRHVFELEYIIEDEGGAHHIHVSKTKKSGADFYIVKEDGSKELVEPGTSQLILLPRRIIGYSSGLNETVSHPFLRTKTLYSQEVREAAPPEGQKPDEGTPVFDTRTLYMDYESNAAIIISNYIFRTQTELEVFEEFTRVSGVASFGVRFNRKRARNTGPNKVVRLTAELEEYLMAFARIAGTSYDNTKHEYDFHFQLTDAIIARFKSEFKSAENLFMAMHKWSLLNALVLSDKQRNAYLSSDITKGALERPPSVPPSDRIFSIKDLRLKLASPSIEIDYSGLSDGEHQFMQLFGTVLLFSEPGTLFLFDEPESHFNPEWRTKFNLILSRLPNAATQEFMISTHSPYIVSGSLQENVYKFARKSDGIEFGAVDFETYGATFDVLLRKLFSIDSLIDEGARNELQDIIGRGNEAEMNAALQKFAESKEKRRLYEALIRKEGE